MGMCPRRIQQWKIPEPRCLDSAMGGFPGSSPGIVLVSAA